MSVSTRPILVVGGGLGGLAAALALGRKGRRVIVLEQAEDFAWIHTHGRPAWGPGRDGPFNLTKFNLLGLPDDDTVDNADFPSIWNAGLREGTSLNWAGETQDPLAVYIDSALGIGAPPETVTDDMLEDIGGGFLVYSGADRVFAIGSGCRCGTGLPGRWWTTGNGLDWTEHAETPPILHTVVGSPIGLIAVGQEDGHRDGQREQDRGHDDDAEDAVDEPHRLVPQFRGLGLDRVPVHHHADHRNLGELDHRRQIERH